MLTVIKKTRTLPSVIVWKSIGSPGTDQDSSSVQARRYGANGQPRGDQFQVNLTTAGGQFDPSVSGDPDARYVVVWEQDEEMLMARALLGSILILSDGFEDGTFSAWSFVIQ